MGKLDHHYFKLNVNYYYFIDINFHSIELCTNIVFTFAIKIKVFRLFSNSATLFPFLVNIQFISIIFHAQC